MKYNELIEEIKQTNLPVVIFGAGIVGEVVLFSLRENGFEPVNFVDNNTDKVGSKVNGITVVGLNELINTNKQFCFIVAISLHKEIEIQLNESGFTKVYDSVPLVKDFDISKYTFTRSIQEVQGYIGSYLRHRKQQTVTPEKVKLLEICWLITQKCSLKCNGCANLMHYFKNPLNFSAEQNIKDLSDILNSVDAIERVSVTGGEAFMHPELEKILEWVIAQDKVNNVTIFTNCTILPSERVLTLLKNPKMYISLSNYGEASCKFQEWNELMIKNEINFNVVKERIWKDFGDLKPRNRTEEQNAELFKKCIYDGSYSLMNGKIHFCARGASGTEMCAFPSSEEDYVDVRKFDGDYIALRKTIINYANRKKAPTACEHCDGKTYSSMHIPVAQQLVKPLDI